MKYLLVLLLACVAAWFSMPESFRVGKPPARAPGRGGYNAEAGEAARGGSSRRSSRGSVREVFSEAGRGYNPARRSSRSPSRRSSRGGRLE